MLYILSSIKNWIRFHFIQRKTNFNHIPTTFKLSVLSLNKVKRKFLFRKFLFMWELTCKGVVNFVLDLTYAYPRVIFTCYISYENLYSPSSTALGLLLGRVSSLASDGGGRHFSVAKTSLTSKILYMSLTFPMIYR